MAGTAADAGGPPASELSRLVQNDSAALLAQCTQAVEQCRADLADLRTAVQAANSRREKCAELLGAATEAVVALEDMLHDPNIDLPQERALQSLANRVQTAIGQGGAVVRVHGHASGVTKLTSKLFSSSALRKFDDCTTELDGLAKQARLARRGPAVQPEPMPLPAASDLLVVDPSSQPAGSPGTGPSSTPGSAPGNGDGTRIRKGSRGQAITALVHVPATEDQPPGHLGFLWFYLSRGLFSGGLYQLDLSKQQESELQGAGNDPGISCMCYDDVNHVVWAGHRNGGIRVWSVAKGEPLVELHPAFRSSVSAITTDERGCCWAASDKGKVRCFQLEALEADGILQGYRIAKLGELNTVSEGMPVEYGNAELVNGMVVHPKAREPAHYGPVRSIAAARGRVWTCGGSSAFASFKEWTQQGVLLGSQSMRYTGLANDMALVSQVVNVQENRRVSFDAPGTFGGEASGFTFKQVVDVEMPWQLLTVLDSGAIQVWGVVDRVLVPLARIGDRAAPALRLIVCEPLGALITAHKDGSLRLHALPHYSSPDAIRITYQDWEPAQLKVAVLPCLQISPRKPGLLHAVGGGLLGLITAAKDGTLTHFSTVELRRAVEKYNSRHADQIEIWPAEKVEEGQFPVLQLSPAGLTHHVDEVQRAIMAAHSGPEGLDSSTAISGLASSGSAGIGAAVPPALASDPLVSWILSSQPSSKTRSGTSASRSQGSGSAQVRDWELAWADLKLQHAVGSGSYGKVYLANWGTMPVAVKVLMAPGTASANLATPAAAQEALALPPSVLAELESEAGLLASIRHPYCVNFFGLTRDPPALVTEYCARGSVAELLNRARAEPALAAELTWRRRLGMLLNAAEGMVYLHNHRRAPIIHRDFKSPNLLVDDSWRTKVTDFGLSRAMEDTALFSSVSVTNPRWLAPELMRGEHATQASDVFAFGVVMWEVLTWERPWGATNPWQISSAVLSGRRLQVPDPAALPGPAADSPEAFAAYVQLMQQCWAQAPGDRPSYPEVVQALRAMLGEEAPMGPVNSS